MITAKDNTLLNKTYYDKNLLANAEPKFVHQKYGQKRPIPANQGTKAVFDRIEPFNVDEAMTPLTEGVTPDPLSLDSSTVEVEVAQYGRHIVVTDLLKKTNYHNVVQKSTTLLGQLLGTVLERVTRNAMCAGTNVQYANGRTSRLTIVAGDKLTVLEIRRAARTLKKGDAKMFESTPDGKTRRPHFMCICSPDATFDLQSDSLWQDVSKYSNAEQIYSGELGRMFNIVFVESNEAMVYQQSVLTAVASHSAGSADVVVDEITDAAAKYLVEGAKIKIGTTEYTVDSCVQSTKTITLSAVVASAISADVLVYSEDAGALDSTTKAGIDVHATLIFGAEAYGMTDIDGDGTVETILHGLGSAGSGDALNQRATVGAKVEAYAAKLLNNYWLVRIEHSVSA